MSEPLHILLPSDVFPPRCGGAGWSAHALALALRERGHTVEALVPQQGQKGQSQADVLGIPTTRWGYNAPSIPFVKNYARHEALWPRFAKLIEQAAANPRGKLLLHAQHVQVTPPSVIAGKKLAAPVVTTIRDHWPWDYFATGLHGDQVPMQYQTWASLMSDLPMRLGPLKGTLALPALPYMLAHMRRRQYYLRHADAVIAVSDYIASRLRGLVPAERLHVIPNMVDLDQIERSIAEPTQSIAPNTPFLLFVGKLERNKGAHLLLDVFRALKTRPDAEAVLKLPIIFAGNGALRPELERELGQLGLQTQFLDWVEHDEILRLMAQCTALLFPSSWGEPLSRVLLEALSCGAPIIAMPTGGTPSAIRDGQNGLLAATPGRFAQQLAELIAQPAQQAQLRQAARHSARTRYAREVVVQQVEQLYYQLTQ